MLVVPIKHIRHINTLEESQETLRLLKKMHEIAEKLIHEAH